MSFLVKKAFYNDYRCCCYSSWYDDEEWLVSKEEALAQVPKSLPSSCLEFIQVVDGSTGEVIAEANLDWPKLGRSYYYRYSRWFGHIEGVYFEEITSGDVVISDRDWSQILEELANDNLQSDLRKKKSELQTLQNQVDLLKK